MIHDLSGETSASSADLLAEWSPAGYAEKASATLGSSSVIGEHMAGDGSRADFVQALGALGAGQTIDHLRPEPESHQTVPLYVSCPYETWVKVFGDPESVIEYYKDPMRLAVQVWEHRCKDGPVTCVGHIFEHQSGSRWVIAFRIGFIPTGREPDAAIPTVFYGSRQDFGKRIQAIAGVSSAEELLATCADLSVVPTHVSCSYEAWVKEFGEPQSVVEFRDPSTKLALNVWKQGCTVGSVTCVGHIFERSPGVRWVVLARARFE